MAIRAVPSSKRLVRALRAVPLVSNAVFPAPQRRARSVLAAEAAAPRRAAANSSPLVARRSRMSLYGVRCPDICGALPPAVGGARALASFPNTCAARRAGAPTGSGALARPPLRRGIHLVPDAPLPERVRIVEVGPRDGLQVRRMQPPAASRADTRLSAYAVIPCVHRGAERANAGAGRRQGGVH